MRLRVREVIDTLRAGPERTGYAATLVRRGRGVLTYLIPYVLEWSLDEGPEDTLILCVRDGQADAVGRHAEERLVLEASGAGCATRLWLLCPDCGHRARILYRPVARPGLRFACRSCHGLTYRSRQAHDKFLDPYLRMHPLRRACVADHLTDPYDKLRVLATAGRGWSHTHAYYERRWERQAESGPVALPPALLARIERGDDDGVRLDLVGKSFARMRARG